MLINKRQQSNVTLFRKHLQKNQYYALEFCPLQQTTPPQFFKACTAICYQCPSLCYVDYFCATASCFSVQEVVEQKKV